MSEDEADSLFKVAEKDNGPTPVKVQCHACGSWWVSSPFVKFNCLTCDESLTAYPAIELVNENQVSSNNQEEER